jgi:hypothetical protein
MPTLRLLAQICLSTLVAGRVVATRPNVAVAHQTVIGQPLDLTRVTELPLCLTGPLFADLSVFVVNSELGLDVSR